MTIGDQAVARIGRTPEARVRWFLRFAARDLAGLSPPARRAAWDGVFAVQSRQPVRVGLSALGEAALEATQKALRDAIADFANGRCHDLWVPDMTWTFRPPVRRPTGARVSAPITRESPEAQTGRYVMPSAVVIAFVDDLNRIGADRLRACPLVIEEKRCGQIFLATRGQRFCTPRHAQAAAWQKYASTHTAERKLRRP
jgi:hypothetical protein